MDRQYVPGHRGIERGGIPAPSFLGEFRRHRGHGPSMYAPATVQAGSVARPRAFNPFGSLQTWEAGKWCGRRHRCNHACRSSMDHGMPLMLEWRRHVILRIGPRVPLGSNSFVCTEWLGEKEWLPTDVRHEHRSPSRRANNTLKRVDPSSHPGATHTSFAPFITNVLSWWDCLVDA